MQAETIDTVIVGGGQAGLAISSHLRDRGVPHVILERKRIGERWRSERWDGLVANGPAWHDRFPPKEFSDTAPEGFAPRASMVQYLVEFADQIEAPIRIGVDVERVSADGDGYLVETSEGAWRARNVVAATGPFQRPLIPPVVPDGADVQQIHSVAYKNPEQIADGAVLVVGAGSSGAQIADELMRSGRRVFLSIGPHDRPPRAYRGQDYCWWLGVLGKWEMTTPPEGKEHTTISVSGAHGGETVDFRRLAARGMTLLGMTDQYAGGEITFRPDLADNIRAGDENYLSVLTEADAYIEARALDYPSEPEAHVIDPDPECMTNPILSLDLAKEGVSTIIWATGYALDFSWLQVDAFDENGAPSHDKGVSKAEGVYFLGLPWLSMRGSSFIWGSWVDAERLAGHIADRA